MRNRDNFNILSIKQVSIFFSWNSCVITDEVDVSDESMLELLDNAFENLSESNESWKSLNQPKFLKDKLFERNPDKDADEPALTGMDSVLKNCCINFLERI